VGTGILAGALLLVIVFAWERVGASEQYGMPSEQEAHGQSSSGDGSTFEQVARVKSLRKQEDRLFVNGVPFVLGRETRIEDERGRRVGIGDIPLGAQIEMQGQTGSSLEDSAYGPETRILLRLRVLHSPQGKKPTP
jgi:hypothetical protein